MQKKLSSHLFIFLFLAIIPFGCTVSQVVADSKISKTPTSIIGFNHIGISVQDLDVMLGFYQEATGFELLKREKLSQSPIADDLLGVENIVYETATLKGPNMLLELTEYSNQQNANITKMPPQGPGMTHTCYQTADWNSGYDKFKNTGASILSRGDGPVDLGGYGVTYAYGYDPEGNMMELEQLAEIRLKVDSTWLQTNPMWMTQVALISPDLDKLDDFYEMVFAIPPAREGKYNNHPRLNDVVDIDSLVLQATWFDMDGLSKMLELMQYDNPKTAQPTSIKNPTELGYSFSLEVTDIQGEYNRLKDQGVVFLSEPQILGEFWLVYTNDVDGNVFSLRQPTNPQSIYSLKNMKTQSIEP